ncbi:hypothetical protein [Clostridium sp. YIM B02569]|uniref:hypothetical protein n=1 Tax=Clostridium sp. YIM B02569 TaxID=2911967 RepID=UPI001EEBC17A|nr:hypothetical protein [Clostridium sp. YIM B02569]
MFTDDELHEMALTAIYNHYNGKYEKADIEANYPLAIKLFINNISKIMNSKTPGVRSFTEGKQSMTFDSELEALTLTKDVLALLPKKGNLRVW